jgi:membrane protein insertase Oxa1/YidC/SpoIIIJ
MERVKMKYMRKQHGIYPLISLLNIGQLPLHLVYISMINRLSYNYEVNPAILTEGFFWFKDLSAPDPTGILPIIGGAVSLLNILTSSGGNASPAMRKFRKYL